MIKSLTLEDWPDVNSILSSWQGEPHLGLDSWSPFRLRDELSQAQALGYLASAQNACSAFLLYRKPHPLQCEVTLLATARESVHQGCMKQVLAHLLSQFGVGSQVFLEVHEQNWRARRFYERVGFEKLALRPNYYQDGGDALLYRYTLQQPVRSI